MKPQIKEIGNKPDKLIFTNPSQSRESTLIVEWGKRSLSFSVFHEQDNRVLHTDILEFEKELIDFTKQDFNRFFKAHSIFGYSFEKTLCLVDTKYATLVPNDLFTTGENEEFLRFVHDLPSGNFTFPNEAILSTDYQLIYALPKLLQESLSKHFINVNYSISQVSLLNYFSKFTQLDEFFGVHFNGDELFVFCYKESHLQFYNSFPYISSEDIVYNVLNVLNELGLSNERCVVYNTGMMPEDSAHIKLLNQYVKFLKPLERSNKLNYSTSVAAKPSHYFIHHYASIL